MRQLAIIFFVFLAILFAANSQPSLAQQWYTITDLGLGHAASINNNGQVVGYTMGAFPVGDSAILFDTTGQGNNTNLGSSRAFSINDSGQIVGGIGHAIYYKANPDGTYTAEVMTYGGAHSVNNNGQMVGYYRNPNDYGPSPPVAVIFKYNTVLHQYETTSLGGGEAYSNNDNGQIVGNSNSDVAWSWNPDGSGGYTSKSLGTLSGYSQSTAYSINNSGKIVGYGYAPDTSGSSAVLFDETGGYNNVYLGTLSGYTSSWAHEINNSGQIVGACFNSNFFGHATLFDLTGAGNNIDLNTVVVNPLTGWTLIDATSINDNGYIVGWMSNPDVSGHAFLLAPVPEPATILLITLAAPFLLRRK